MHSGSLRPEHLIQQLGNCRILHKSLWTQLPHNISLIHDLKYSLLLTPNLNLFPSLHPWASPGLNVICHSQRPQWWKETHCTEGLATDLNTGRETKSHGEKGFEGAMARCEVCRLLFLCLFLGCSPQQCSGGSGVCGLCMGSSALAGASHPSLLCCSWRCCAEHQHSAWLQGRCSLEPCVKKPENC